MSQTLPNELPSAARLLKATAAALAAAAAVLVTVVLPAEYGIDPTGIGARLGLLALARPAEAATAPQVAKSVAQAASSPSDTEAEAMAVQAVAVFGKQPGQT
ncbi:MAG: transmembrane anchor protein, partial [Limnohabitans sp.]